MTPNYHTTLFQSDKNIFTTISTTNPFVSSCVCVNGPLTYTRAAKNTHTSKCVRRKDKNNFVPQKHFKIAHHMPSDQPASDLPHHE